MNQTYPNVVHRFFLFVGLLLCVAGATTAVAEDALTLASPDNRMQVKIELSEKDGIRDCPIYSVTWSGRTILLPSRLELTLEGAPLQGPFKLVQTSVDSKDSAWKPVWGERSTIVDRYNERKILLQETSSPNRQLEIIFRAFDEGLAFRYQLSAQPSLSEFTIKKEHSEFCFAGDHSAWMTRVSQGTYVQANISSMTSVCERPLTMQASDDLFLSIAEARQVDYSRMKLGPLKGNPHAIVSEIEGPVTGKTPFNTPWRVVMVANSPGELLENNDIFLNLNDPCAIADTSWIKPGKVIRDVSLTTTGGKACVDFCVKHNLQYVIESAGWYGNEFTNEADAATVTLDPKRSKGPLDMQEVIRYGEEKGIGIMVYVNRNQLEKQLDEILPLYEKWGLKGIKYGFVRTGSQQWTNWMHDAVKKAADHKFVLSIHDDYRPVGFSRTYPNLMTMEGIRGDEESPKTEHTLITLFTRMLAGPGDNTICYFAGRVNTMGSHGAQLAKSVCLFSPLQWMYWYDRPEGSPLDSGGAGDSMLFIEEVPELEFFDALPTVWDDTKVLDGCIGEYAVVARRSGEDWFIGALNGAQERTIDLQLDFLKPGQKYTAHLYRDDPQVETSTQIRVDRKSVNSQSVLRCELKPQGGQAIRITPAN
ncbi:Retaining alpha-galactosidase precursor [Planctomycetes bacterium CA13]|uniref:Retaining alpha-galactosidase n=1 Tax=Novipirellula herctigrandis TaxID=2527986 RepID=A0A5C5ZB77_9BACT|nr:Retaining alpha-galactosidase precursor [Planctomycetes bacterium CA13]